MRRSRVVTLEQAHATTAVLQGQVEAEQARALAQVQVEQARAAAAREDRAAEQAARAAVAAERAVARDAAAQARRVRRAAARDRRRSAWTERRALVSVLPIMGTSAAVALPAQLEAFEALTGSPWSAAAIAAMVEGGTWAGAAMESIAVRRSQPTGCYVALTWGCASIACGMQVVHSLWPAHGEGSGQLAVAFGMASLLGPTVWAVYSRLQRHIVAGRTGEQALLAAVRRLRFPIESWRALSLRAAQGAEVTVEEAWASVWASRQARRAARRQATVQVLARVLRRSTAGRELASEQPALSTATLTPAAVTAGELVDDPARVEVGVEVGGGLDEQVAGAVSVPAPPAPPAPPPAPPAPRPRPSVPRPAGPRPGSQSRPGSRSLDELRAQLVEAVRAGRLPATPSADAIRHELACSPGRARTLRDERHALTEQVAGQLDLDDTVADSRADDVADSRADDVADSPAVLEPVVVEPVVVESVVESERAA